MPACSQDAFPSLSPGVFVTAVPWGTAAHQGAVGCVQRGLPASTGNWGGVLLQYRCCPLALLHGLRMCQTTAETYPILPIMLVLL